MGRRIRWLGLVLIVAFAVVLAQLINIQLREATALNADRTNPRNTVKAVDNQRGLILASTGALVLAKSVRVPKGSPDQQEYYRQYATGSLYSDIVGYSSSYYGTSGVEYTYNTYLRLHTQKAQTLEQLLNPPAPSTDNVILTVNPSLQKLGLAELAAVPDTNKDGAVVVEEVKTGSILAMVSNPTYTNNGLSTPTQTKEMAAYQAATTPDHEDLPAYPPLAYWHTFAPGSTFKVVTSTAVYNLKPTLAGFTYKVSGCTGKGAIPDTTKQICNDAHTPTNASPCGGTLAQMLPESCDPGYAMLGLHLGGTVLYQQASAFGYDQVPPIDEHPVQKSHFPTPKTFKITGSLGPPGVAYSAFGQQTVSSTALQGAMVAQGIADTGTVLDPHVMSQIRGATGRLVKGYSPTVYKHAASASAAQAVNKLMQGVVSTPAGTAYGVGFPKTEDVAVKTGTAQAGTGINQSIDWMIGFAPAYDPVVAVAVVVPEQVASTSGAEIAGPIVKAMVAAALAAVPHSSTPPTTTTNPTTAPKVVYTGTGTVGPTTTTTLPPGATTTTTAPATGTTTTTTTAPATGTTTTTTTAPATGTTTATTAATDAAADALTASAVSLARPPTQPVQAATAPTTATKAVRRVRDVLHAGAHRHLPHTSTTRQRRSPLTVAA